MKFTEANDNVWPMLDHPTNVNIVQMLTLTVRLVNQRASDKTVSSINERIFFFFLRRTRQSPARRYHTAQRFVTIRYARCVVDH